MSVKLTAAQARERVEELEAELAELRQVRTFEVLGAHIPMTTVEYANGVVEVDVVGNIVAVRLHDDCPAEAML